MIYFVKGVLDAVGENQVVIENHGIGYRIMVPLSVMSALPQTGREIKLYTYMNVREDAIQLYGFLAKDELEMFKLLINVNGIGPKGALGILSVMDADMLRFAIMADDAKTIAKAPGIGAKTAGKVILELKDRINFEPVVEDGPDLDAGSDSPNTGVAANEAVQALTALGYTGAEAAKAVKKVCTEPDMTVEDILKASLRIL